MEPAYLLDEHISPLAASILRKAGVDALAVAASNLAGSADEMILRQAVGQRRILVTYNIGDFALLYGQLLREGLDLPGIVFVDVRSFRTSEPAKLAKALRSLAAKIRKGQVRPEGGVFLTR